MLIAKPTIRDRTGAHTAAGYLCLELLRVSRRNTRNTVGGAECVGVGPDWTTAPSRAGGLLPAASPGLDLHLGGTAPVASSLPTSDGPGHQKQHERGEIGGLGGAWNLQAPVSRFEGSDDIVSPTEDKSWASLRAGFFHHSQQRLQWIAQHANRPR